MSVVRSLKKVMLNTRPRAFFCSTTIRRFNSETNDVARKEMLVEHLPKVSTSAGTTLLSSDDVSLSPDDQPLIASEEEYLSPYWKSMESRVTRRKTKARTDNASSRSTRHGSAWDAENV